MIKKTIIFDEKVVVWQRNTVHCVCPEGETDEQTYARIREMGPSNTCEFDGDNTVFNETEEAIPDPKTGSGYTLDFGDQSDNPAENLGVQDTVDADDDEDEDDHEEDDIDRLLN